MTIFEAIKAYGTPLPVDVLYDVNTCTMREFAEMCAVSDYEAKKRFAEAAKKRREDAEAVYYGDR